MFKLPLLPRPQGRKPSKPKIELDFSDLTFANVYGPGRTLKGRELERRRKELERRDAEGAIERERKRKAGYLW